MTLLDRNERVNGSSAGDDGRNAEAIGQATVRRVAVGVQGTKTTSGMTDPRDIGRPVSFKGDEGKCGAWKAKLLAFLRVAVQLRVVDPMVWVAVDGDQESDMDLNSATMRSPSKFYSILQSCTEHDTFRICFSVKDGRVGSHGVVDETARTEDSWHSEGFVEGGD